ncbi:MAG: PIG-L family deacetylase [Anaerolineales bacterium]|nr:PIG-L family deacetylase [Anaerolineales bacterium]
METIREKRTLLSVLAHPDDESFGMGGTLAKYAEDGTDVHLICATRGEAGEVAPEFLDGQPSIAHLREMELRCAVDKLGINEVQLLDYRDSGMSGSTDNTNPEALINAPVDQVAKEIAEYIRKIKPQVILTFDPIGGYRHPDHIFIHQATTKAFYLAGDPAFKSSYPPYKPGKLYYHTIPRHFVRFNVRLLRLTGKDPTKYGKNKDIDLTQIASQDFPIHARINYAAVKDKKEAAAACHASQGGGGLTRGFIKWIIWLLRIKPEDQFMQAYPELEQILVKKDLFS